MRKRVLWGHHVSEYQAMFDLSEAQLKGKLLEYGCGPSAFNAELHHKGGDVTSLDPLFTYDKKDLVKEVTAGFDERVKQVLKDPTQFDVAPYGGMGAFLSSRREGMHLFFEDYDAGCKEKRYQPLPVGELAFDDFAFDLALSSHYLFATAEVSQIDLHLKVILDLARVAKEVRIFPLIEREGEPSVLLGPVLLGLQQANYGAEVREVAHALYPQGNAMLRVWSQGCAV